MLSWAITFILLALTSAFLGFSGLAGAFTVIAKICFFLFIALFVISLIRHLTADKTGSPKI